MSIGEATVKGSYPRNRVSIGPEKVLLRPIDVYKACSFYVRLVSLRSQQRFRSNEEGETNGMHSKLPLLVQLSLTLPWMGLQ
jgi:hypothetical protein